MGCIHSSTKKEILRSSSGKLYNRKVKRQRKFRSGLHVEKTSEMGAEANFQAAITTDITEEYARANGNGNHKEVANTIPKILEMVTSEVQTDPPLVKKVNNNIEK